MAQVVSNNTVDQSPDPHRNGRNNSAQSVDEALIDFISETLEAPLEIANKNYYTSEEKTQKLTKFLQRACSNNEVEEVEKLLSQVRDYLDLDKPDSDGTPPLVYASCFGYSDIVKHLLVNGASVNVQDKIGWPALMWATNNNHEVIVKLLLENGASPSTKTAKGRTVVDIINHGLSGDNNQKNVKLTEILSYNFQKRHQPRQSVVSCFSLNALDDSRDDDTLSLSSMAFTDPEGIQDEFAKVDSDKFGQIETLGHNLEDMINGQSDGYKDETLNEFMDTEFIWDQCMPDQMYVFTEEQIPHILSTVVTNIKPMYTREQKLAPANVIFLCARFAHHYSTPDLLDCLLNGFINELATRLRKHSEDTMLITFWMANTTQLLYYIKKDTSLVTGTVDHQLSLSELVHEIYQLLVKEAQNKLHLELNQAILNCETIPGLSDESKFGLKKKSFLFGLGGGDEDNEDQSGDSGSSSISLRRTLSLRRKPKASHAGINGKSKPSPATITNILANTLLVLQTYEVHPMLVHHILNQLIYYISCHLFNQILTHKKYCCRSRAMQIRMNITTIEDWIRNHGSSPLVHHLTHHFKPLIQLLQFLQIYSAHNSTQEYLDTLKSLEDLTPLQLRRVSDNYRYETDEPRIPDEIVDYIKVISDQVICQQLESKAATRDGRQSMILEDVDTTPTPRIPPHIMVNNNSNTLSSEPSEFSSDPNSPNVIKSTEISPVSSHRDNDSVDLDLQMAEGIDSITIQPATPSRSPILTPNPTISYSHQHEFKDPNHLLPFSIPTQSEMASFNPNKPGNIPAIPEDIIGLLDNKKTINGK